MSLCQTQLLNFWSNVSAFLCPMTHHVINTCSELSTVPRTHKKELESHFYFLSISSFLSFSRFTFEPHIKKSLFYLPLVKVFTIYQCITTSFLPFPLLSFTTTLPHSLKSTAGAANRTGLHEKIKST